MPAPSTLRFIGLDIGGSFLKGACVNPAGKVEGRLHERVEKDTLEALLGQLERAVRSLAGPSGARAVGVGIPGIVEQNTGRVFVAPNVPSLNGYALGEEFSKRVGMPIFADNDANAAALAEAWLGAGRGSERQIFVSLGTGIGAGLILDGRIWSGTSGYAGEVGHIQVDPKGLPCGCGSRGCVETIAGIAGWVRRAEAALATRESSLRGQELDPKSIVAAAQAGDTLALEIVDESADALGVGIGATLNLLNLDRVVLGGGIAAAGDFLLTRIAEAVRKRTFAQVFSDCDFRLAELAGDAGLVGAARVAIIGLSR
jgi:glucokinase